MNSNLRAALSKYKLLILCFVSLMLISVCGIATAAKYTPKGPLPVPRIPQNRAYSDGSIALDCHLNSLASIQAYMLGSYSFTPNARENKDVMLNRTYNGPGDYNYSKDPVWWKLYQSFGFDNAPKYNSSLYPVPMNFQYNVSLASLLNISYEQLSRGVPICVYRSSGPHASVIIGYRGNSDTLSAKDFTVMEIKPYGSGWQNSAALFNQYASNPSTTYSSSVTHCYVTLDAWLKGSSIKVVSYPSGSLAKSLSVSSTDGGSVSGTLSSGSTYVTKGTQVVLTAVPDAGYLFSKWVITGVPGLSEYSDNTLSFPMPENEVCIQAVFVRNILQTITKWQSVSSTTATQSTITVSGQFYYGVGGTFPVYHQPSFYIIWAKDEDSVNNATPDNNGNSIVQGLGQLEGTSPAIFEHYYNLSVTLGKVPVPLLDIELLKAGDTVYYKWVAEINGKYIDSSVGIGKTKGQSVTWSNLHTDDTQYGLFNAQVNWDKNLTMKEVGCFVSMDQSSISNAKASSYSGCSMKKDTSIEKMSSLATDSYYGTIVFYRGPSFGDITSFTPGTTYYYKFYSITSDGEEAHSAIATYIPSGNSVQGLTNVWMTPNTNLTVAEGTTVNFQYGADQSSTFYLHVYDKSNGVDNSYKQLENVKSGFCNFTFNASGSYQVWIGAAHSLGDMASNGIIITVTANDTGKPSIVTAETVNINREGYDVVVKATDDTGVTRIRIGTWHSGISVEDAKWQEIAAATGTFHVSVSDFDNVTNVTYYTNVFAYDAAGNESSVARAGSVEIETQVPVIESASIEQVSSDGYNVNYCAKDNSMVRAIHINVANDKGTNLNSIIYFGDNGGNESNISVSGSYRVDTNDPSLCGTRDTIYHTTIFAEDYCGNVSESITLEDVFVGDMNLYDLRDEALTMRLPEGLVVIEDEAFEYVSARFFIIPVTVERIGSCSFPYGSTVFLNTNAGVKVQPDTIEGYGTFVEMSDKYNTTFARQMENSSSEYVLLNGTKPPQWGAWSDWSDNPAVTDSQTQVETKKVYRFRDTTYITEYSEWSDWSGYDTARKAIEDANLIQEESARVYVWYWYECSNCHASSPKYGSKVCPDCGGNVSSDYNVVWLPQNTNSSGTYSITRAGLTRTAYNISGVVGPVYYNPTDNKDKTYTGYRYRTRTSYQKPVVGEWTSYQDEIPESNTNREIESKMMFRFRKRNY